MAMIIWTIGLIVFGLVCAALGFVARELADSYGKKKKNTSSKVAAVALPQHKQVPEARSTERMVLQESVIELPSEGGNETDLQIIEGIGPKIEQLLKMHGITTRTKLAGASLDELRRILANAGATYQMHDPSTWSYQARLAIEGRWAELNEYQDFLVGGKQ